MSASLPILLLLLVAVPHGWCCYVPHRVSAHPPAKCCTHCAGVPSPRPNGPAQGQKDACPCDESGIFAREAAKTDCTAPQPARNMVATTAIADANLASGIGPSPTTVGLGDTGPPGKQRPLFRRHCALRL